jgi:hypothetical protein
VRALVLHQDGQPQLVTVDVYGGAQFDPLSALGCHVEKRQADLALEDLLALGIDSRT